MVLTEKQKRELHEAILDYLQSEGDVFKATASAFREEAKLPTPSASTGILEKKWLSIVRLQKKIMELEGQLASKKSNVNAGSVTATCRLIPKSPPAGTLSGHRSAVTCLATHPQFSLLASGSDDRTIKLWDFETMTYERTLSGHSDAITGLAFDNLGRYIISCSIDTTAKVWDLKSFTCTATLRGHDHAISGIIVMPPAGEFVLTCSRDHTIKAWEIATGFCTKTYVGQTDWVKTIAIVPNGEYFAGGGVDQTICLWRNNQVGCIQTLRGHEHVVESIAFGGRSVTAPAAENAQSSASTASTDNADAELLLASASRDRTVRVWDALRGLCLMVFSSHENWVRGVIFDPTLRYLTSCSDDKSVRVFDLKEQRCIRTIDDAHSHFVSCITASSCRPVYFTGSVDKTIAVWSCYD